MKLYRQNGYEFFYDKYEKHWALYPIDSNGLRIELDINDNPIESQYFINKKELIVFITKH